ncbi:Kelch repeat-containing protein [Tenggerimyces flavus]|uniref:Kelch repeat-containing protein n=1 Tax=Tenggerimyces flavus TaxID=1708749 RepID=A0ABV7YAI6_9ACTN|nr:hypothetical protein [Tenggerimyces flavus]MBM7783657.1 N-acetylneuraminic acid mutarotase [Tenggerimyces flavus]
MIRAALLAGLLAPLAIAMPVAAASTVTLSGVVRDGSGQDWPLRSSVSVTGGSSTHSSPFNGKYNVEVQPNKTYTVTVQPSAVGYPALTREVSVGRRDLTVDFAVPVDADSCQAPGYHHTSQGAVASFDSGPDGWTITDPLGTEQVWRFDDPGEHGNLTGGLGGFAILDSEFYGFDKAQDSSLMSPVVDLRGVSAPTIGFRSDLYLFDYTEPSGIADVDLSLDGGATWSNVWRADVIRRGPEQVTVPIPQAAGERFVRARFRYHETENTAGVWWQVDSAWVGNRSCDPAPGGLVVGYVRDRNTGTGLVGATVRGPSGSSVSSVEGGLYSLFSPVTGSREVVASSAEYLSHVRRVTVGVAPVRSDFSLAAGQVKTSSTSVEAEVELGEKDTATVTLRNRGSADASVTLAERPGSFELASARVASEGAPLRREKGSFSPFAAGAATRTASAGQPAAVSAADGWGGVADYPIAISDNAAATYQGKVYSVGGQEHLRYGISEAFVFDPAAGGWSELPALPRGRQAATAAFLDGKLHVVGGWSESDWGYDAHVVPEMDIYDPATGTWSSGPRIPAATAAAGRAVLDDRLYVVGGCQGPEQCDATAVYRYDPADLVWERLADYPDEVSWLSCGAIEEQLYCAGGTRNWQRPVSSQATYSYNPRTDTWTRRADLPIDLWASASSVSDGRLELIGGVTDGTQLVTNEGFAYSPLSDSWTALPRSTYATYRGAAACGIYKVGGGTSHTLGSPFVEVLAGHSDCGADRDTSWLSATPGSVELAPGDRSTVRMRFDSSVVSQPGTYTSTLLVREDSPYPTGTIALTLSVSPPRRWGLLRGTVTGVSCEGVARVLAGATVWLDGRLDDFTLPTDASGSYARWLDSRNGPATMITGLDGWVPDVRSVSLRAGRTTVADVVLQQDGC